MEAAIEETEDILNAAPTIIDAVPFANILKQLKTFFEAAQVKLNNDKKILEQKRQEQAGEVETEFARERRVSDEAAFERKREFAEEETERFEGIREETEERRKEGEIRQQEERELEARYFDAIRADDFILADQILNELRDLAERG